MRAQASLVCDSLTRMKDIVPLLVWIRVPNQPYPLKPQSSRSNLDTYSLLYHHSEPFLIEGSEK